jgi:hypothetical protein
LAKISLEAGKAIERVSILAGQLEEISLFLVIAREEKAVMALKVRCIICCLMILRV